MFRFAALIACAVTCTLAGPLQPYLWPAPADMTQGTTRTYVQPRSPDTFFIFKGPTKTTPNTLTRAFERYRTLTFPHVVTPGPHGAKSGRNGGAVSAAELPSVIVHVEHVDESHPQIDTDESYRLDVPNDGSSAVISAPNVYAAMRGLETLSQLVGFDFAAQAFFVDHTPIRIQVMRLTVIRRRMWFASPAGPYLHGGDRTVERVYE